MSELLPHVIGGERIAEVSAELSLNPSGRSSYGAREQGFAAPEFYTHEFYTQVKTAYSWA